MRKRIVAFLMLFAWLFAVGGATALSAATVDTKAPSTLTLQYSRGGEAFEGVEVKIHRVADVFADGSFAFTAAFGSYPVRINGITTQAEWKTVTSTLESYITTDSIAPTYTAVTDKDGVVKLENLLPGLYLTESVRVEKEGKVTVFFTFLTALPGMDDSGERIYDVTAYPKSESWEPTPEETEYRVVKQWKDIGYESERPESVEVDIFKDGVLYSTQNLSPENDWSYSWKAPDDGSVWQVIERNIPENYTVTFTNNGNIFIITNEYITSGTEEPPPPRTGDTTVIWPYVIAMCISGGFILIVATRRKRNEA